MTDTKGCWVFMLGWDSSNEWFYVAHTLSVFFFLLFPLPVLGGLIKILSCTTTVRREGGGSHFTIKGVGPGQTKGGRSAAHEGTVDILAFDETSYDNITETETGPAQGHMHMQSAG